jgi:hypothetical protein
MGCIVTNHQPVPFRSLKNNAPPDDVGRRLQGRFGRDDHATGPGGDGGRRRRERSDESAGTSE